MEGEESESDISMEQAMVVLPESEGEPQDQDTEIPEVRGQKPPEYNPAGKIQPPRPEDSEFETFRNAMLFPKMEGSEFDAALDDLSELSHDIYYGVEIVKDGPVLERLVCLLARQPFGHEVENRKGRDHKAASILGNAVQNNPTALKELSKMQDSILYPTCETNAHGDTKSGDSIVKLLHSQLSMEHNPAALRAKVSALSGFLRDPSIRNKFIADGGMELLLTIFLKEGDGKWSTVKEKVANLVMDNFLDEEMGAVLGIWPKLPVSANEVCQNSDKETSDGCWEYHLEKFLASSNSDADKDWGAELLRTLEKQRPRVKEHEDL
ncbi:putative nucleotide exchange factor SIL1 [Xylogone sp. PMI_703]|nr:putative nucleotide exchange factor SIL1 [Xylogone sp. PMI_703]